MTRYADGIAVGVGAVAVLLLVILETTSLWRDKRAITDRTGEARKLVSEVDGHELSLPAKNAADHSERVFAAWEELPHAESLSAWDFYITAASGRP